VLKIWTALAGFVKRYPAAVAAGLNVVVVVAAKFGFHVSVTTLAVIASAVAAVLGAWVHTRVSPVKKKAAAS
jgi:hypothetical protein